MSQKELFQKIIDKLTSKYSIKSKLIPTFRYMDNNKSLYIVLKYKRKTEYNIYQTTDVYFSITIDEKFPDILPYVRALSSFSFPSLYDNSNLYHNIILFKDSNLNAKYRDPFLLIEDIVLGIPLFLENIKSNEEKKIFYYYGEYSLDEIYDINDFFLGQSLEFFRVKQIIKNNETKKYIILNDVYFLLFDPVPDCNNYAKLIFISDILQLNNIKDIEQKDNIYNLEMKNNIDNELIKMSFKFEKNNIGNFINSKNLRINKLMVKYNIRLNNEHDKIKEINQSFGINGYINHNYNTRGFQISKSFECDIKDN